VLRPDDRIRLHHLAIGMDFQVCHETYPREKTKIKAGRTFFRFLPGIGSLCSIHFPCRKKSQTQCLSRPSSRQFQPTSMMPTRRCTSSSTSSTSMVYYCRKIAVQGKDEAKKDERIIDSKTQIVGRQNCFKAKCFTLVFVSGKTIC